MSFKYALYPNILTEDPEDYIGKLQEVETADQDTLIEMMTKSGGVSETHVRAVMTEYRKCTIELLKLGFAVNDGLIRIYPTLKGTFISDEDRFDNSRHQLAVQSTPTKDLKNILNDAQVSRVKPNIYLPELYVFEDIHTDTKSQKLSPGKMGKVKGNLLQFDKDDNEQGIFFADQSGNETRCVEYAEMKPSSIIFIIPDTLTANSYDIIFRSRKNSISGIREASLNVFITRV